MFKKVVSEAAAGRRAESTVSNTFQALREREPSWRAFSTSALRLLVEIDTEKHAEEAQQVHFQHNPERQFQQDQVQCHGWINSGCERRGEDILNGPFWGHHS